MPAAGADDACGRREVAVEQREAQRHRLEPGPQQVAAPCVAPVRPSIAAPARSLQPGAALAGEQRQHRSARALSGAISGDRALGLLRLRAAGSSRAARRTDAAAVRQRCRRAAAAPRRRGRHHSEGEGSGGVGAVEHSQPRRWCRSSAPRGPCVTQPAPTLEVAPSPQAAEPRDVRAARASARPTSPVSAVARGRRRRIAGGVVLTAQVGGELASPTCRRADRASRSPEAIETLSAPRRRAGGAGRTRQDETPRWRTRANVSGWRVAQPRRSLGAASSSSAGARPVRTWTARSSSRSRRPRGPGGRARVGPASRRGVESDRPRSSRPIRECQQRGGRHRGDLAALGGTVVDHSGPRGSSRSARARPRAVAARARVRACSPSGRGRPRPTATRARRTSRRRGRASEVLEEVQAQVSRARPGP